MKIERLIIFFAILLLLHSCSSMYIPAVRSIPLLESKGEFQGETGVSTNSVYVNASIAITDDIALSVNGNLSYRNFTNRYDIFTHKDDKNSSGWSTSDLRGKFAHRYGELSVGKINMLPVKILMFEAFGGAGMGRATDIDYFRNNTRYKTDYYSLWGQGNFGIKTLIAEAGGSLRVVCSMFDYTANFYRESGESFFYQDKFGAFSFEPMIFARVGSENLKAVFRIGLNLMLPININKEDIAYYYRGFTDLGNLDYTVFHFSIGLSFRHRWK